MTTTHKASDADIFDALRHLAKSLSTAADRAHTLDAEDQRHREASQVRFVATMFEREPVEWRSLALCWIAAARRIVTRYADQDAEAQR